MRESYRLLDHAADAGAEIFSPSREGLVRASVAALADLFGLGEPGENREKVVGVILRGTGETPEEQLIDLLNEWLGLVMKRQVWPVIHGVCWDSKGIEAAVEIHEPDGSRILQREIKAVTYHTASVSPPQHGGELWTSRWVVDL